MPTPLLAKIARFLPALHRIAGTTLGVETGLRVLFGLPLRSLHLESGEAPLPAGHTVRLGVANGRLGVDAVIGSGVRVRGIAVVEIGPVTLTEYLSQDTPTARARRDLLYRLVMPSGVFRVREQWRVVPPPDGLALGVPHAPVRLGVNSRLEVATREDGPK